VRAADRNLVRLFMRVGAKHPLAAIAYVAARGYSAWRHWRNPTVFVDGYEPVSSTKA
jgi:hypothetical protein